MAEIYKENGRKYWRAAYYVAAIGKRRFKSTKTRNARTAQAIADQYERQANTPGDPAPDPTSIDDAVEEMLKALREEVAAGRRSPGTVHMYKVKTGHLKRIFAVDDVPMDISDIDAAKVDAMISKRREEGAKENTIAKELTALGRMLRLMKRRGRWRGDLDAVLPYRFAPQYKPRERFLKDVDELRLLLNHLTPDHAARAAFEVATSANLGETFHALREDLGAGGTLIRGTKRMSRWRVVPTVTDWQRELLAFVVEQAQGVAGKLFLFDAGYDSALEQACVDAKLPHTTSNDLRRTFCHWMKDAGALREHVAAAMGHKGMKMVDQVYGKPTLDELKRQMQRSIGGTDVAQTSAHSMDDTDGGGGRGGRKSRKRDAEAGTRTRTRLPSGDFKSHQKYALTPRAYKRNRVYSKAGGTDVAQREASADVVELPRKARR